MDPGDPAGFGVDGHHHKEGRGTNLLGCVQKRMIKGCDAVGFRHGVMDLCKYRGEDDR